MGFHLLRPSRQLVEELAPTLETGAGLAKMVGPLALANLIERTCRCSKRYSMLLCTALCSLAGNPMSDERSRCLSTLSDVWAEKYFAKLEAATTQVCTAPHQSTQLYSIPRRSGCLLSPSSTIFAPPEPLRCSAPSRAAIRPSTTKCRREQSGGAFRTLYFIFIYYIFLCPGRASGAAFTHKLPRSSSYQSS